MPERTPEEREAARLERERRRGRLAAPAPMRAPAPDADLGGWTPAYRAFGRPADQPDPEPGPDPESLPGPEPAPHSDPEPATDDHEIASGTRRVGWHERSGGAAAPPRRDQPQGRAPRPPGAPRTRRTLLVRIGAVLVLVLAAAVIWFCVELFQPFHGSGHGSVTVDIPPRAGARRVGDLLARDGVVASGLFFYLRATLDGDRGKLLAGTYHLRLDMSYSQALKALTTPPPAARVTEVTTIPGTTRRQTAALLRAQGIRGSYLAATRRSPLLPFSAYGAPPSTPSLEGFLFPDTYQLRVPVSVGALVADQLTAFKRAFAGVDLRHARSRRLSPYDVLIIASIIEKEAATAHDRPLVASVIYNRLKDGIPLGMDSTTRYEFNDYTTPLTTAQLATRSPYNTRLNKGLPPTPIGNPGLAAIEAAAHPAATNYLYFVVKPCGNGASVFSSDYKQFLAASARYQLARSRRGGRSPVKC
jgi:peptidoglycan lytic transglycosylase G